MKDWGKPKPGEIVYWMGELGPGHFPCVACGEHSIGYIWGFHGAALCAKHAEECSDMIKLDLLVNGA